MTNQNQAGTKLCGRFVLIEKLGAGGYGEVWRARDELRDTEIAVKVLYSQFAESAPAWEVFQREFTLTARLNHPGVLRVYEPVRGADATVLPMVLAGGGDLRQMRGASYTKILPLLIDIAAALEYAHARRIVHRDLKPSNILLDSLGRPLLADFGAGASEGDNTSGPPGSPFSASPQQLAGDPARPADDIYGLGALAYELLSGYPPFYPAFDARKIATEPVPRLKSVKPIPPRLELLVSWLLAKQGRERPPSMRHVADEINAVLQDTLGLENAPADAAAQPSEALLGAAADNLTPVAMSDDTFARENTSVRELEQIDPGMLPQVDELRAQVVREQRSRNRRRGWAIAAVLVVVTTAVAFLLPRLASNQKVDIATLNVPAGPSDADVAAEKHAKELGAQHTELSKRVLELDSRAAAQWGGADFAAVRKSLDDIGGMLERKKYSEADAPLTALEKILTEMETRLPAALAVQLSEGKRALAAGEFENARQAYETALKIEVINEEATEGLARVAAASGVLPTLVDAENAESAKDLPRAQSLFADVLKRNPGNTAATDGLARVRRSIAENEFNAEMGAGLAALNAGRLAEARTHLENARKLRPDSGEVGAALQRVADTGAGRSVADEEQRAAGLASQERWTEAQAIYDEALARDPSLQFAVAGRAAVAPRAELGKRLQALIDKPDRLAEDNVRVDAERLLTRARALSQGPVIRSQVQRLELLLPTFNQPVVLALESDNATEVAIQRVGYFGSFDKRQVELKPGKYTVTGKRSGFRDVRREITVAPGQAGQTIVIRCLEPI